MEDVNPYLSPQGDSQAPAAERADKFIQSLKLQSAERGQSSANRPYHFGCKCGRVHFVTAAQAGGVVACGCGVTADVPSLSRLRVAAGQEPIPLSTVERIYAMIAAKELPMGDNCVCCGRPADLVAFLHVECERSRLAGGGWNWLAIAAGAAIAVWLAFVAQRFTRSEVHGRETSVDLPLRVSSLCQRRLLRLRRQRKLKRLLKTVPLYERLLLEYPRAVVTPVQT